MGEKWDRMAKVTAALTGIVFLTLFYRRVERDFHAGEAAVPGDARLETAVVRAPARLIQFAKENPGRHSHEELVLRLRRAGLENAWFAFTDRVYLGHQEMEPRTVILRAGQDAANLGETLDILATLAGDSPRHQFLDRTKARIAVIPDELLGMEPLNSLRDLEEAERIGCRRERDH